PFFHQEQTADTIQKPAGVDDVRRIALPGRQLTVRNVVAKRRAGLGIEDAVQLLQQRRAQNVRQLGAVVADDRVQASVFLGSVVPPLGWISPMGLENMAEARLQLRDQQVRRRREITLEEP